MRFKVRFTQVVLLGLISILLVSCFGTSSEDISGVWHFASGESEGYNTAVSGTLTLNTDGRYEDSHRIAGILTFSKGTYRAKGGNLTLTPDSGTGKVINYDYHIGAQKDASGKEFPAMTLTSQGLRFLLTKKD